MNWKAAAIGGGIGFVLSVLSGLIGGVPVLDVILRALFWAVLLGGAVIGIEALLRSQLPELFDGSGVPPPPSTDEAIDAGGRVDITLADDGAEPEIRRPLEAEGDEGFEGELPEPSREALEADEEPAFRPRPTANHRAPKAEPAPDDGAGDEVLPELGAFMESFNAGGGAGEAEVDDAPYTGSSGGSKTVNIDGEEHDPAILAQAVKTVLKKDQQG